MPKFEYELERVKKEQTVESEVLHEKHDCYNLVKLIT